MVTAWNLFGAFRGAAGDGSGASRPNSALARLNKSAAICHPTLNLPAG
jgi:hypothetical protein